jgi:hypothetical protein
MQGVTNSLSALVQAQVFEGAASLTSCAGTYPYEAVPELLLESEVVGAWQREVLCHIAKPQRAVAAAGYYCTRQLKDIRVLCIIAIAWHKVPVVRW